MSRLKIFAGMLFGTITGMFLGGKYRKEIFSLFKKAKRKLFNYLTGLK